LDAVVHLLVGPTVATRVTAVASQARVACRTHTGPLGLKWVVKIVLNGQGSYNALSRPHDFIFSETVSERMRETSGGCPP